jgi:hypothetical protein
MIGAGLALTSKTVRDRAAEAAAPAMDKAKEMLDEAAGRAQALRGDVQDAVSSAQSQATGWLEFVFLVRSKSLMRASFQVFVLREGLKVAATTSPATSLSVSAMF